MRYLLNFPQTAAWRSGVKDGVDCSSFYSPLQFYVSRLETSTVLKDLKPETEYVVNVYSVVEDEYSEPLKGTEKTRKSSGEQQQRYNPIISFTRQRKRSWHMGDFCQPLTNPLCSSH